MRRFSYGFIVIFILFLSIFSCREDLDYQTASHPLRFSKDTILLDTVFSTIRSQTYVLKVYNQQNEDVTIPLIYLDKGINSQFKINVDGTPGTHENNNRFVNVPIKAKDKISIFIEVAPKSIDSTSLVADEDLIFNTLGNSQKVKLLTLIEDADFYYSAGGNIKINSDLVWDKSKPKVIYGNLEIDNGSKLTIEEDSQIYFHKDASLIINNKSKLFVNGTLNSKVTFRSDRRNARYDSLAGNWKQIKLMPQAEATINYSLLKGGENAFYLEEGSKLNITNTEIYNFLYSGIYSEGGNVVGQNLAMNNFGLAALFVENGGNYNFTHCTFANYWNLTTGTTYSVYLSNKQQNSAENIYKDLSVTFNNNIFWGRSANNLYLDNKNLKLFNYKFNTNLIRNSNLNINTDSNFNNTILDKDPLFNKTGYSNTVLSLKPNSPAKNNGNPNFSVTVPLDILGVDRALNPSLGAYQ